MSKKYNSGELQQIIESKDLWKRDYEDLIKSMHKIRRDFIYIPAMSMMANAYQAQFKSSGLLASATFNRLNVNLPKPALNFCLTELVDTIRERQSRYVAYTDYKLPLIKPNENQIKSLVNDVVEKYAENVTEKLP